MKDKVTIQKQMVLLGNKLKQYDVNSEKYNNIKTQIASLKWVLENNEINIAQNINKKNFVEFG